jgi:hypothetical protein
MSYRIPSRGPQKALPRASLGSSRGTLPKGGPIEGNYENPVGKTLRGRLKSQA